MRTTKRSNSDIKEMSTLTKIIIFIFLIFCFSVPASFAQADKEFAREKLTRYAKGQLIVKFKPGFIDSKEKAAGLIVPKLGSDFENFATKHKVKESRKVFKERRIEKPKEGFVNRLLGKKDVVVATFEEQVDVVKKKFPKRTSRALKGVIPPNLDNVYQLSFDESVDVKELAKEISRNPNVLYAEPNYSVDTYNTPNDPYNSSSESWGQEYPDLWGLKNIQAESAWNINQGSQDIVVAVIDTGVDYSHPDIAANMWINKDETPDNKIDDDNNGFVDDVRGWDFFYSDNNPMDGHGHGTHVSGTVAAVGDNGQGIVGVTWRCKIMAIKGLSDSGSGYEDDLAAALRYAADNGADILSNSWGGPGESRVIKDAVDYAYSLGCVIVAAAGNSDADTSDFQPASLENVITVAAFDHNDKKADFSNWGAKIDVAAPGGDSTDEEDSDAKYCNILSLRAHDTDMYGDGYHIVGQNYYRARGTSMACPYVSGLAALILSNKPTFTNDEVRAVIRASADDIVDPLGDGSNLCGFDIYSGYGRINAYKALQINSVLTANIISPTNNTAISGKVDITGIAKGSAFQSYKLEYGVGEQPAEWRQILYDTTAVENGLLGTWNIGDIPSGKYTIRLTALDASGNEFIDSVTVNLVVSGLAGWPIELGQSIFSSPTVGDLDKDGDLELVVGCYDNKVYAWHHDGSVVSGWPKTTGGNVASSPALADLDSDADLEIIVGSNDGKVYAWHHDGSVVSGWPNSDAKAAIFSSVSIADLDKNGSPEIIVGSYDKKLYVFKADGKAFDGWPQVTGDSIVSSPATADLDKDGYPEIIVGSCDKKIYAWKKDGTILDGWPVVTEAEVVSSPAIADIDEDGQPEVVIGSNDGKLYCLNADGANAAGWPANIGYNIAIESSPVIADIDGDGHLEVIVGANDGKVYCFSNNGALKTGWPFATGGRVVSSCAITNLDSDSSLEIIVGSDDNRVYALNDDGTVFEEMVFQTKGAVQSSPIVKDLDHDGDLEVAVGSFDKKFYIWALSSKNKITAKDWVEFGHDTHNSSEYNHSVGESPIPLPTQEPQGNLPGGDRSHISYVNYSFEGQPGSLTLEYQAYNIARSNEVEILLNGTSLGYASTTSPDQWGNTQTLNLPDNFINDNSINYILFDNKYNPPQGLIWGIRDIKLVGTVMPPTISGVASPTNQTRQLLTGTKQANTSIWINNELAVSIGPSTTWQYDAPLNREGDNIINLYAKEQAGNQSRTITVIIVRDTVKPVKPTVNSFISPTKDKTQVLNGAKEAETSIWVNAKLAIPLSSSAKWSYSTQLTEGNNQFIIIAKDKAGNESDPLDARIALDTEAPGITITSPTEGQTIIMGQ